jgi:hypothetical protein
MQHPPAGATIGAVIGLIATVWLGASIPSWWAGTSSISPTSPPPAWPWSAALWRRNLYGLLACVTTVTFGALAILAAYVSAAASNALIVLCVASCAVWLLELALARPRFLIPPRWRPEQD